MLVAGINLLYLPSDTRIVASDPDVFVRRHFPDCCWGGLAQHFNAPEAAVGALHGLRSSRLIGRRTFVTSAQRRFDDLALFAQFVGQRCKHLAVAVVVGVIP